RQFKVKLQVDYTSVTMDQSIEVTASDQANLAPLKQTADGLADPAFKYIGLDGSWRLGEGWAAAPGAANTDKKQMGWWGRQLAGPDGLFTEPLPTLTVTFFSRPLHSLQVVGDSKRGEYPVDFTITLYNSEGQALH